MRTLLIDNYDSFTFNLFHLLGEVNGDEPIVVRNDELSWEELAALAGRQHRDLARPRAPGARARRRRLARRAPARRGAGARRLPRPPGARPRTGGAIDHAPEVMHGRLSEIHHDGRGLFAGVPQGFAAVRYHSLAVGAVPATLRVTAWTPDDVVMGLEHRVAAAVGRAVPPRVDLHRARRARCCATSATSRTRSGAGRRARRGPPAGPAAGPRVHHRALDDLVRPRGRVRRALRRPRARRLARQRARGAGARALLVHGRPRRPARPGRALRRRDAGAHRRSCAASARSCARACSTTASAS